MPDQQPPGSHYHMQRAEAIAAQVDDLYGRSDLAGAAWAAGVANMHLLAAIAIELGAPRQHPANNVPAPDLTGPRPGRSTPAGP